MKIKLKNLKNIINIISINNIDDEQIFDYFRIVKINNDEILNNKNVLFFPIYITKEEIKKEGWYLKPLDNRLRINEYIQNNPERFYVVDLETANKITSKEAKYIVVDNIISSIDKLFEFCMQNKKDFILATGSVGKTTTISLIEQIIDEKVLRIYSKRITPLILKAYIINYINDDIDYIIMEAGMFRKFQVEYYAKLLKPKIGILLNIEEDHFGIDGINSLDDIIKSKAKLLLHCDYAIINNMDKTIQNLTFENNELRYKDILIGTHNLKKIIKINEYDNNLIPYINTNLSKLQSTIAKETGILLGIKEKNIIEKINLAIPKENRIQKIKTNSHEIIFDGEVSGIARLKSLSDHNYTNSVFIIYYLTNEGEEKEDYSKLIEIFNNFDNIYINKNIKEASLFNNCQNVIFFDNVNFITKIPETTQIFYHYGSYYRKYNFIDKKLLFGEEQIMKTILLIHGWDYDNYNHRTKNKDAWDNRKQLIKALKKKYNVIYPNLPGFGNNIEPKEKQWTLDDYTNYINKYIKDNNLNIDYILGYSFGGAVAIRYKKKINNSIKLILISPAIIRDYKSNRKFIKTPKLFNPLREFLRNLYTIYVTKTPEMKYGTKFLRNTYQLIVREELIDELETFNPNDLLIIYGENDNMVNPNRVISLIKPEIKIKIKIIKNGKHDIANTHTEELANIIYKND